MIITTKAIHGGTVLEGQSFLGDEMIEISCGEEREEKNSESQSERRGGRGCSYCLLTAASPHFIPVKENNISNKTVKAVEWIMLIYHL